jgi:hypothetical protein
MVVISYKRLTGRYESAALYLVRGADGRPLEFGLAQDNGEILTRFTEPEVYGIPNDEPGGPVSVPEAA